MPEGMLSVLMTQELVASEADAKKLLKQTKKEDGCIGGRVLPPPKAQKGKWTVQAYFTDNGGRPPPGMARFFLQAEQAKKEYGIQFA